MSSIFCHPFRYSESNIYAVTHIDSVFGWEAMEAEPIFSTKPITQTKTTFPSVQSDPNSNGSAVIAPDYVADCVFDPSAPADPLCIIGRKGTGDAALVKVKKGKEFYWPVSA